MRWIFLFVFSLNLIYIGWQLSVPSDDLYAGVKALKNVPPIVLLSEVKQAEQLALLESVQAETSKTEGAEQGEAAVEKAAAEKVVAEKRQGDSGSAVNVMPVISGMAAERDAGAGAEMPVKNTNVEPDASIKASVKASVDTPVNVSVNATVKAEAVEAEPEKIEAIAASETEKPAPAIAQAAITPAAVTQAMTSCFTLGPFRDLDKLRSFTREIKSYVIETDFRGREEKVQSLYWVYVNPEKTRKKAVATGKRLKAKKIKDFYLVREGEKLHSLSLGYFRNKDGAYGLAKKVRKLGFNVTVEPIFKTQTLYWLDYRLSDGVTIPQSIFDKHIKASKKDSVTRLSRECGA